VTARDHRTHLMARAQASVAAMERGCGAQSEAAARASQREAMAGGVLVDNGAGRVLQTNAALRTLLALDVHTGFRVLSLPKEDGMP
jgi:hypothetical protein